MRYFTTAVKEKPSELSNAQRGPRNNTDSYMWSPSQMTLPLQRDELVLNSWQQGYNLPVLWLKKRDIAVNLSIIHSSINPKVIASSVISCDVLLRLFKFTQWDVISQNMSHSLTEEADTK